MQYVELGSGNTLTMSVSGVNITEATISNLMSSSNYSIQVAAVNSAGTGVYCDVTIYGTLDCRFIIACGSA